VQAGLLTVRPGKSWEVSVMEKRCVVVVVGGFPDDIGEIKVYRG